MIRKIAKRLAQSCPLQRRFGESKSDPNVGKPVFGDLCKVFDKVSISKGRNEKISFLVEYMRKVNSEDLSLVSKLCAATVDPHVPLRIGKANLTKLLARLFSLEEAEAKMLTQKHGDVGETAFTLAQTNPSVLQTQESPAFLCETILEDLREFNLIQGKDSTELRISKLVEIAKKCRSPTELKYFVRILTGELRIGIKEKSITTAIKLSAPSEVQVELSKMADKDILGKQVSSREIICGFPLQPMLGRPMASGEEIQKYFTKKYGNNVICEIKYDGERSQIHYNQGELKMFSRNGELQVEKYPDLAFEIANYLSLTKVKSCILDSEIISSDASGKIFAFQELAKKYTENKVLSAIAFDVMMKNGESLIDTPIIERKKILQSILSTKNSFIKPIEYAVMDLTNQNFITDLNEQFYAARCLNCEGVMIKNANADSSCYNITSSRTQWLKLKTSGYDMLDNFDLVPIAGYLGVGKRRGVYSSYLMAAYQAETETFHPICKVGTGFSDEELIEFHTLLQKSVSPTKPTSILINSKLKPDCWLYPSVVWELESQHFTQSSLYEIGKSKFSRGISLRFPRFRRARSDKVPIQATTTSQIIEMYQQSTKVKPNPQI